ALSHTPPPPHSSTLSLHDALPISNPCPSEDRIRARADTESVPERRQNPCASGDRIRGRAKTVVPTIFRARLGVVSNARGCARTSRRFAGIASRPPPRGGCSRTGGLLAFRPWNR